MASQKPRDEPAAAGQGGVTQAPAGGRPGAGAVQPLIAQAAALIEITTCAGPQRHMRSIGNEEHNDG